MRAQNGPLISAPTNVDIIGDRQSNPTYSRFINTCYQTRQVSTYSTPSAGMRLRFHLRRLIVNAYLHHSTTATF
jgi:hypothetical protein